MGVYIPNEDMPKDCYTCFCYETEFNMCSLTGKRLDDIRIRQDDCALIEIDLEKDIPTIWYNRQTGQFEPKGTKQEVYKRIYKLQNGGRSVDDNTIKANK